LKVTVKHYGIVERGKKKYYQPDLYERQLQSLEGKRFVEIIQECKQKPSVSQFNYYRGGILPTCYQSEMFCHLDNKDKIHDLYFAKKFLTHRELVVLKDEKYEVNITRSLADLSQDEMSEFIEKVLAKCAELDIDILSPEQYYNKYYSKKQI
jgi:hypothetical protein